jgi:hypothetical protein
LMGYIPCAELIFIPIGSCKFCHFYHFQQRLVEGPQWA